MCYQSYGVTLRKRVLFSSSSFHTRGLQLELSPLALPLFHPLVDLDLGLDPPERERAHRNADDEDRGDCRRRGGGAR
eukprot:930703-Rhodomonas_salina.1